MNIDIDSSKTLIIGIVASIFFTILIWITDQLWFQEPILLPKPDGIAFWYKWQLLEPSFISRFSVWVLFLLHQCSIWWLIYKAQKSQPKYTNGLHWFNIAALLVNALFIVLHLIQSSIWYDGLAQDVTEVSAQWSVIVLLFVVLIMENQRRGMFFGKPLNFVTAAAKGLRKYHGYYFAWATIYTFWYHPMIMTQGHIFGFFYMFLLLLQGSLFFTRAHLNSNWTTFVEVMVVVHALMVALMIGHNWPMFVFGFLGIFMVTQLYGLPLSQKTRMFFWALFLGFYLLVYNSQEWENFYEIIFITSTEWGCAMLLSGLILFFQSEFIKNLLNTKKI